MLLIIIKWNCLHSIRRMRVKMKVQMFFCTVVLFLKTQTGFDEKPVCA